MGKEKSAKPQLAKILIVEDNEGIGRSLLRGFLENGFEAEWTRTAAEAVTRFADFTPNVIVLDRMLPDGEGLDLIARFHAASPRPAVIVLSALTSVEDRVAGLDQGADDYLPKPFSFAELLARVRAVLRRGTETGLVLQVGDLKVDLRTRAVERGGVRIDLTSTESALLEFLMRHPGEVVTRKMILHAVWEPGVENVTNVVDVYINRLRNKIDKGAERTLIHTARGLGYVLQEG
jgi:two-component system, OmpR family, response regulator